MFSARLSTDLQRNIDLTDAFKRFFRDVFFSAMQQNRWIPWETGLGVLGRRARAIARAPARPRAREAKGHKVWILPRPLPEPFFRAAGKSLAQG